MEVIQNLTNWNMQSILADISLLIIGANDNRSHEQANVRDFYYHIKSFRLSLFISSLLFVLIQYSQLRLPLNQLK